MAVVPVDGSIAKETTARNRENMNKCVTKTVQVQTILLSQPQFGLFFPPRNPLRKLIFFFFACVTFSCGGEKERQAEVNQTCFHLLIYLVLPMEVSLYMQNRQKRYTLAAAGCRGEGAGSSRVLGWKGLAPARCRGMGVGSGRVPEGGKGWLRQGGGGGVGSGRVLRQGAGGRGWLRQGAGGYGGWLRQGAGGMGVGSGRVPGVWGLAPAGCRGGGVGSGRVLRVWGLAPAGCRGRGLLRQGAGVSSGMMQGDGGWLRQVAGGKGGEGWHGGLCTSNTFHVYLYIYIYIYINIIYIYIYIYIILNINIYIYSFIILI